MHSIHPHWQEEEDIVPVHAKIQDTTRPQSVSRSPAAIVGILIASGIGAIFFWGTDVLRGQITSPQDSAIVITENGFLPQILEVSPGDSITWINQEEHSHILSSSTLCNNQEECFRTNSLFPGDQASLFIDPSMPSGTYTYISETNPAFEGTIVIVTISDSSTFESVTTEVPNSTSPDFLGETQTRMQEEFIPIPSPLETSNTAPVPTLPVNPYTVDSTNIHPFNSFGQPIPEAFGDTQEEVQQFQEALHSGAGPVSQPHTGASHWVIAIGGCIGILLTYWIHTRNTSIILR